jgi:hypothetical protein
MEMTVLANIFCSLLVYICWWYKPSDVELGHDPLPLNKTIEAIIGDDCPIACGNHQVPVDYYHDTPLDFVSRDEWSSSLIWRYYVNILRSMHLLKLFNLTRERPAQRISSFNWPRPSSKRESLWRTELCLLFVAWCYTSWFLAAWNFQFPSSDERNIWRAITVTQLVVCVLIVFAEIIPEKSRRGNQELENATSNTLPEKSTNASAALPVSLSDAERGGSRPDAQFLKRLRKRWNHPYSNEVGNFPSLAIPLKSLCTWTPIAAIYCVCRWFILAEDVVAIRSLPASAYQEVDWTPYWPWF